MLPELQKEALKTGKRYKCFVINGTLNPEDPVEPAYTGWQHGSTKIAQELSQQVAEKLEKDVVLWDKKRMAPVNFYINWYIRKNPDNTYSTLSQIEYSKILEGIVDKELAEYNAKSFDNLVESAKEKDEADTRIEQKSDAFISTLLDYESALKECPDLNMNYKYRDLVISKIKELFE